MAVADDARAPSDSVEERDREFEEFDSLQSDSVVDAIGEDEPSYVILERLRAGPHVGDLFGHPRALAFRRSFDERLAEYRAGCFGRLFHDRRGVVFEHRS